MPGEIVDSVEMLRRLVAFDTKAVLEEENPYYRSASMIAAGSAGGTLP